MVRWEPNSRGRLIQAAVALYGEHGYEQTTVAEIAKRAGLTERTFFRHFADKREVLFSGSAELQELLVNAVAGAPERAAPIDAVAAALLATDTVFLAEQRDSSRQRRSVIDANAELRERELTKLATLSAAVTTALRDRGVGDLAASLAAETGIAVFKVAFERWLADPGEHGLAHFIKESLAELKGLVDP